MQLLCNVLIRRHLFNFNLVILTISLFLNSYEVIAQNDSMLLLKAGRLFNSDKGTFSNNMAVLIKNEVIVGVRPFNSVTEKELASYRMVDLSGYCVMPGLMDAHTHLLHKETLIANGKQESGPDMANSLIFKGDAYRAVYGAARAKAYLEAGITSVQDLGNSGQFADIALQKAIADNIVPGPRMKCSGPGFSGVGGQLPGVIFKHQTIISDEYRIIKGKEDAIQAVRENIAAGATVIKVFSDNAPNNTRLSVEEMTAIVQEAHALNRRVTAHAIFNESVYNAIVAGVDGIDHGYDIADSTLALMKKKGTVLVPTDGDSITMQAYAKLAGFDHAAYDEELKKYLKSIQDRLKRANKAGVMIVYGSDDYIDLHLPFGEASKRTLISYREAGMSVPAILQAATFNAATHFGWTNFLGTIKEGLLADIIAVDKNISENIEAILKVNFVMKAGKIYVNK